MQVTEWMRQLLERAADIFDGAGNKAENEPDLKVLHAKIGQQALEIDFLGSGPTKAGLLSAESPCIGPTGGTVRRAGRPPIEHESSAPFQNVS